MSEVIDLANYAKRRQTSTNTSPASAAAENASWYRPVEEFSSGPFLSAGVLRKLDVESELSRFVGLANEALDRLSVCQRLLASDPLGADDQFIGCKPIFIEMLMFRDLSDAVGLIALKSMQVAASVKAVVDAPELPSVLERVLTRVRAAPFMSFEEACVLADEIEGKAALKPVPGFVELSNELIKASEATRDLVEND
jgi:hypothetical protein